MTKRQQLKEQLESAAKQFDSLPVRMREQARYSGGDEHTAKKPASSKAGPEGKE